MNSRHRAACRIGLAVAMLAFAGGTVAQESAARVLQRVQAELHKCIAAQACDVNPCASNGGLKYCYSQASLIWDQQTTILESSISRRGGWCLTYWSELKGAHQAFEDAALQVPSLADAPFDTDDDLALLVQQQRFELARSVLDNSSCKSGRPGEKSAK